ncbi:MAG: hypothetical protein ACLVFG_00885 [Lachnospiraceae bacterium]
MELQRYDLLLIGMSESDAWILCIGLKDSDYVKVCNHSTDLVEKYMLGRYLKDNIGNLFRLIISATLKTIRARYQKDKNTGYLENAPKGQDLKEKKYLANNSKYYLVIHHCYGQVHETWI